MALLTSLADVRRVLEEARTVAVLGASDRHDRAAWYVPDAVARAGYTIIPVRPQGGVLHGRPCAHSLDEITESVDIVNIFRRTEALPEHLPELLRLLPKVVWLPYDVSGAALLPALTAAGIDLIEDRCMKVDLQLLPGGRRHGGSR